VTPPRCPGNTTPIHIHSFQCVLDAGHDGRCKPYQAPTVDEFRALMAELGRVKAGK